MSSRRSSIHGEERFFANVLLLIVFLSVSILEIGILERPFTIPSKIFISPSQTQAEIAISIPITPTDIIDRSRETSGRATRQSEIITVGVPLPDRANIRDVRDLQLISGVSGTPLPAAQIKATGNWSNGNIKWVLVSFPATVPGTTGGSRFVGKGEQVILTRATGDGGTRGGLDMAVDNGSTITVNTGAAQFTLSKANFNGFNTVNVNATELVSARQSDGVRATADLDGNGTEELYYSKNDPNSTIVIEQNGPVKTLLKAQGKLLDSTGRWLMDYTAYMEFDRGKTTVPVRLLARNTTPTNFKVVRLHDMSFSVKMNMTGDPRVTINQDATTDYSRSLTSSDSAVFYQAMTNTKVEGISLCAMGSGGKPKNDYWMGCPWFDKNGGLHKIYGEAIYLNGTMTAESSLTANSAGASRYSFFNYLDLSDSNNRGVDVSIDKLPYLWPGALRAKGNGVVEIGIFPKENYEIANNGFIFPVFTTEGRQFTFDFHTASPNPYMTAFNRYYPIQGWVPPSVFNDAKVFADKLASKEEVNQVLAEIYPTRSDLRLSGDNYNLGGSASGDADFIRFRYGSLPGGDNQHDAGFNAFARFAETGEGAAWLEWQRWVQYRQEVGNTRYDNMVGGQCPGAPGNPPVVQTAIPFLSPNGTLIDHEYFASKADRGHRNSINGQEVSYFVLGDPESRDAAIDIAEGMICEGRGDVRDSRITDLRIKDQLLAQGFRGLQFIYTIDPYYHYDQVIRSYPGAYSASAFGWSKDRMYDFLRNYLNFTLTKNYDYNSCSLTGSGWYNDPGSDSRSYYDGGFTSGGPARESGFMFVSKSQHDGKEIRASIATMRPNEPLLPLLNQRGLGFAEFAYDYVYLSCAGDVTKRGTRAHITLTKKASDGSCQMVYPEGGDACNIRPAYDSEEGGREGTVCFHPAYDLANTLYELTGDANELAKGVNYLQCAVQNGRLSRHWTRTEFTSFVKNYLEAGASLDATAPSAPTNHRSEAPAFDQVRMTWTVSNDNVGVAGYKVDISASSDFSTKITGWNGRDVGNVLAILADGLTASTRYYSRVVAYDAAGNISTFSNVANVTTPGRAPRAPSGLKATTFSASEIQLNWSDNSSDETRFVIQARADNPAFQDVAVIEANLRSYLVSGLKASRGYDFRVRACNANGCSDSSITRGRTANDASGGGTVPTDRTAPLVTITAPSDGLAVRPGQTVVVIADAYDAVGVTRVEFYQDGVLAGGCTSTAAPYTCSRVVPKRLSGTAVSIQVKAYDAVQNVGTSQTVRLLISE